jgi:hypothetical protein
MKGTQGLLKRLGSRPGQASDGRKAQVGNEWRSVCRDTRVRLEAANLIPPFPPSPGAALSRTTQEFLNTTLVTMLQGYGCTETCGMTAILTPAFYQVRRS